MTARLPVLDSRDPSANLYENFPSGWFDLGHSRDLRKGGVLVRRLAGQDVVLYRTESGEARAIAPHCPHMGAHLGHGGRVEGDRIVCPFHAFAFDGTGRCVKTGYDSPPPPRAKVRHYPVHELHGCIFVWYGSAGEAPTFELPHVDDAAEGYLPMRERVFVFRGHPQETSENSVDTGHFPAVHKYVKLDILEPISIEGPVLRTKYAMHRPFVLGYPKLGILYATFQITVRGLGYSLVQVHVPALGLRSRHYVFATALEKEKVQLRIGFAAQKNSLKLPFENRLIRALFEELANQAGIFAFAYDVTQDFKIWRNKAYVHPPQLAVGDGPVGQYRRWAKQFYPLFAPSSPNQAHVITLNTVASAESASMVSDSSPVGAEWSAATVRSDLHRAAELDPSRPSRAEPEASNS